MMLLYVAYHIGCVDRRVFQAGKRGVENFAGKILGICYLIYHRLIPYLAVAISLLFSRSSDEMYAAVDPPVAEPELPPCLLNPALPADVNNDDETATMRYALLTFFGGLFYTEEY